MKVVSIVGARPQFVKAAAVSRVLRDPDRAPTVVEVLIHTGQHYDDAMSAVFFTELEIPSPEYNLGVGSASHGAQTGRMLERIEAVLVEERPQWVLVYGDTNSTLAGSLAAAKLHIPVAHVEAGLRSFNRRMPEETNRVVTDHVSDLLFAPTSTAVENLRHEGVPDERIVVVGDVMFDAVLHHGAAAESRSDILATLGLGSKAFVFATVHRAENTDDPARLRAIVEGLREVAARLPVVVALHPRTEDALRRQGLDGDLAPLRMIPPTGYLDTMMLERHARVVATDSGGVQKEAFFHAVPCVTLRTETEWVELVTAGWNKCVEPASGPGRIAAEILEWAERFPAKGRPNGLYGSGDAAPKIARELIERAGAP